MRTSPVLSNVAWTATSGQLVSGPHSPTRARGSVLATVTVTFDDVVELTESRARAASVWVPLAAVKESQATE